MFSTHLAYQFKQVSDVVEHIAVWLNLFKPPQFQSQLGKIVGKELFLTTIGAYNDFFIQEAFCKEFLFRKPKCMLFEVGLSRKKFDPLQRDGRKKDEIEKNVSHLI